MFTIGEKVIAIRQDSTEKLEWGSMQTIKNIVPSVCACAKYLLDVGIENKSKIHHCPRCKASYPGTGRIRWLSDIYFVRPADSQSAQIIHSKYLEGSLPKFILPFNLGEKVIFQGGSNVAIQWGQSDDPRTVLTVGNIYEVEEVEVHRSHTRIYLIGIQGGFNSGVFAKSH